MNQTHRVSLWRSIKAFAKWHTLRYHGEEKVCDWCDPFVNARGEWRVH